MLVLGYSCNWASLASTFYSWGTTECHSSRFSTVGVQLGCSWVSLAARVQLNVNYAILGVHIWFLKFENAKGNGLWGFKGAISLRGGLKRLLGFVRTLASSSWVPFLLLPWPFGLNFMKFRPILLLM